MDHNEFCRQLTERTGRSSADVDALIDGLSLAVRQACADLDTVAVPTFGSFVPEKHREEVVKDLSTGKQMLLPPEIAVSFVPSARLRNHIVPPTDKVL